MKSDLLDRLTYWLHGELPLWYMHRQHTAFGRLLNRLALRYERRHADVYDAILKPEI